jgi:hypothetical protein
MQPVSDVLLRAPLQAQPVSDAMSNAFFQQLEEEEEEEGEQGMNWGDVLDYDSTWDEAFDDFPDSE